MTIGTHNTVEQVYVQLIGISDDYGGCRDVSENIAAELDALKKERNEAEAEVYKTMETVRDWEAARTVIDKLPQATRDEIYGAVRAQRYLRRNTAKESQP